MDVGKLNHLISNINENIFDPKNTGFIIFIILPGQLSLEFNHHQNRKVYCCYYYSNKCTIHHTNPILITTRSHFITERKHLYE